MTFLLKAERGKILAVIKSTISNRLDALGYDDLIESAPIEALILNVLQARVGLKIHVLQLRTVAECVFSKKFDALRNDNLSKPRTRKTAISNALQL